MILIADSGATGTDWRLVDGSGKISQIKTGGFNPYVHGMGRLSVLLEQDLLDSIQQEPGEITVIHYYGAGCSDPVIVSEIRGILSRFFPEAEVEVNHDLLAAARALCDGQPGIACILGTGTNTCYYDGHKIIENLPAMGYAMADEGSGAYLGKQLLNDYFRKGMSETVHERFRNRFGLHRDEVLKQVYYGDSPSQYLASFSKFIFQNLKEPYCYRLVYDSFEAFFERNVMRYDGYREQVVHFTGAVAFYYSNILRQVGQDKGVRIKNISESPISGLTLYHQGGR